MVAHVEWAIYFKEKAPLALFPIGFSALVSGLENVTL
jgi:hypothetical protein